MTKRILSALLAIIMVMSVIPLQVFATETTSVPTFWVDGCYASAGQSVTVEVKVKDNCGIFGAVLTVEYDPRLTLKEASSGEAFSMFVLTPPGQFVSPCNFVWDALATPSTEDGTVLKLTFDVSEDAEPNSKLEIKLSYSEGDITDSNKNPIEPKIENGYVNVIDYIPGDVNGDGFVNPTDISFIRMYRAGGYDNVITSFNQSAADVNDDNRINPTDITWLRQYRAGGYGITLLPHTPRCQHTSLTAVPEKEASCTEPGRKAYWYCDDCGKYFEDEDASTEITIEDTILTVEHQTIYTPAKEATTYADGNIEYWTCSTCGKLFSDSAYVNEITLADTIIQKLTGNTYTVYFKDAQTGKATFVSLDNQETTVSSITKDKTEKYDFPQIKKYGYTALCLTDSEGNIIKGIEAGTTGNVNVYVHWMSNRNQTRPVKELGDPQIIEDRENGQIYFVYEIGEIDNVPIEVLYDAGEIDEEMVHEKTSVKVKNTATENVTSIAETVANATTKSASMTLSEDWTNKYTLDEEWAKTQDQEKVDNLKKYIEDGGQINISSQFGGENTHTDTSGSSSTNTHKATTGKVDTISDENSGKDEYGLSGKFSASTKAEAFGVGGSMGLEISAYLNGEDGWKNTETNQNSSGTEDTNEVTKYSDISDSYSNNWNTEEGYTQSNKIGTETEISTAIRTAITENSKKSYSDEYQRGSLATESQNITHNEGREYSAAITFSEAEEVTDSTTVTLTFKTKGHYRFIRAGKLDVYAVVGYDIKNSTYYTSTFSMFEKETKDIWDFSEDGTFADKEIGVLPFEVPYEVEEYIYGQTAYTNGLEFNYAQGAVTRYVGTAKNVLIPNYYSKNGNMTYVKTLGIDPQTNKPLFAGNENIEVVRLSKYITSIPDGAFEGCTNLKTVIAPGVTSIGANAFNGCKNLNKFIVSTKVTDLGENAFVGCPEVVINASNSSVARAATTAGANKITINVKDMTGVFTEKILDDENNIIADYTDGYTIDIGDIKYFAFYGGDKTFNNVKLVSGAETTYIEKATFTSDSGISLNINSENVTFKGVNVKNDNVAMLSQFDGAKILIAEDSTFGSLTNDKTTKVISKNIELSNLAGETAQWLIDGILYVYGNTEFTGKYIAVAKAITTLSETEFSNYVKGVFTITFNPNGGTVSPSTQSVTYGSTYGDLPVPTRAGYTFNGWYTAATGGTKIAADTTVSAASNHTLYAQWTLNTYKVSWSNVTGVTISVKRTESPYANAQIGSLSSGNTVNYGDVLSVTYSTQTGYTKTSNGKTTITVTGNITSEHIYANATLNTYKVSWSNATGVTISVKRTSSPYANAPTGSLSTGNTVNYGDVLTITYTANTGYTLATKGKTSVTVTGNVTASDIYATATVNSYKATWSVPTGVSITVIRTSSPLAGDSTGTIVSGKTIFYGDVLSITYSANNGYTLATKGKTSITVTGNVTASDIYATATPNEIKYNVIYKSSNGTSLGTDTVTKAFNTTNTITPKTFAGYDTPASQSVKWDSTSAKTITFTYKPTSVAILQTVHNGSMPFDSPYMPITIKVEYKERTATSIKLRMIFTLGIRAGGHWGWYTYYTPAFAGVSPGQIQLVNSSTWNSSSSVERSVTVPASDNTTSYWVEVPVSATTTSVPFTTKIQYSSRSDPKYYDLTDNVTIPAY